MNRYLKNIFTAENRKFIITLALLALPIILQELLNSFVNILDSVMVGSMGVNEINAVGFGNELFFLYILVVFGISSGSSIFMGQYWGKGEVGNIHKVMGICLVSNMVVAGIFVLIAFIFPEPFVFLYSKEPEVVRLGAVYLRIVAVSYFLTSIIVTFNNALRCIGQTKIPMTTTIITLTIDTALSALFIFVLGWGVAGAATATLLARVTELISQMVIIRCLRLPVATRIRNYFSFSWDFVKNIYRSITPVILNESLWALGTTLYNMAYRATGNESQAAVRISASVQNLFMVLGMGIGTAAGIMVSNALGANEIEKAKQYAKKCLRLGMAAAAIMGVLLILFAPAIINIYNVTDAVKTQAFYLMCVVAVVMVFKTYNYTAIVGILRSGGDTKFCLMVDTVAVWCIGVPAAFLCSYVFQFPIYIIVAFVYLEEVFKIILSFLRVKSNVWARRLV